MKEYYRCKNIKKIIKYKKSKNRKNKIKLKSLKLTLLERVLNFEFHLKLYMI